MASILIADDQETLRAALVVALREAGYEVDQAANGEQACAMVDAHAYDLVLTDLMMGRTSGIDVLKHTKETCGQTRVMLMTAFGSIESAVEAMRFGASDYVSKPFAPDELLRKVQAAQFVAEHPGEVCPAKWKPGAETLKPGLDLVGKI